MKLSYIQVRALKDAAKPEGWKIGNTNRTAEALARRGLIADTNRDAISSFDVIYTITDAGRAALAQQ